MTRPPTYQELYHETWEELKKERERLDYLDSLVERVVNDGANDILRIELDLVLEEADLRQNTDARFQA